MSLPTLGELRTTLRLYTIVEADVDDSSEGPEGILAVNWLCGCTARGYDMTSMEHMNCSHHERIHSTAPFPDDRRKKRSM